MLRQPPKSNTAVAASAAVATSDAVASSAAVAGSTDTAVAGSTDTTDAAKQARTCNAAKWIWGERGLETMHPFWAVRRLTETQLQQERMKAKEDKSRIMPLPRFNCEIEYKNTSVVCIAAVGGQCFNRTRILQTPYLTNTEYLIKGDELLLEIHERVKKDAPKRSWQAAAKAEDLKAEQAAALKKRRAAADEKQS